MRGTWLAAVQEEADEGFHIPSTEHLFEWPPIVEIHLFGLDVSINRVVLLLFLAVAIVVLLFGLSAARARMVPRGLQNVTEPIVDFIRNQIALQVIGREGLPWVPFLTTLFMFILVGNLFEIIPGINFPINSRMAFPALLAGVVWVVFNAVGIREQGFFGYFKNMLFPPGVPKPIYILVTPIEFVSTLLVRPLTLSVRLFANMMAGHIILTIFFLGTAYMVSQLPGPVGFFSVASFGLAVILLAFEMLVSLLQAYIFTILTAVYIAGAIHPEH
ncbi:MAG: F0F1 ATP synthase subunit A [Actinomycetota bacterium]|nr:F0F1 ATP synthase subunit A [Actinomycetota bacterium]